MTSYLMQAKQCQSTVMLLYAGYVQGCLAANCFGQERI